IKSNTKLSVSFIHSNAVTIPPTILSPLESHHAFIALNAVENASLTILKTTPRVDFILSNALLIAPMMTGPLLSHQAPTAATASVSHGLPLSIQPVTLW